MNKKTFLVIAVVLMSMLFISGCTQQTVIKSTEEVGHVVTNVSNDIQGVASTLSDIDKSLGGNK